MINPLNPLGGVPLIGKRLAVLRVSPQFLANISVPTGVGLLCTEGLPIGAKLEGISMDNVTGIISLIIEHPSFPLPQAGGQHPEITARFATVTINAPVTEIPPDAIVIDSAPFIQTEEDGKPQ